MDDFGLEINKETNISENGNNTAVESTASDNAAASEEDASFITPKFKKEDSDLKKT